MQPYGVNQLRKMFLESIFYGTGDPAEKESDHMSEVHPHRRY